MHFSRLHRHGVGLALTTALLGLAACGGGGGGGGGGDGGGASGPAISGTAAGGAAITGTVTIEDSTGVTRTATIGSGGTYSIDVEGLTAPFLLRAQGSAPNGTGVTYYSAALAEDVDGTVNITPLTNLITSNALGTLAADVFNSGGFADALTPEQLEAAEAALQAKLAEVLAALGLPATIDLRNAPFDTDHTGVDALLDLIKVSISGSTAFLTNLLDNSVIGQDDLSTNDDDATPVDLTDAQAQELDAIKNDPQAIEDAAAQNQAQGLYFGPATVNSAGDPTALEFSLLSLDDGRYYTFVFDQSQLVGLNEGSSQASDGNYTSADSITYNFNTPPVPGSLAGTYGAPNAAYKGTFTPDDGNAGYTVSYDLARESTETYDYNAEATLVPGVYSGQVLGAVEATFDVQADGSFTGSAGGCSYSGNFTPRMQKNVYDSTLTFGEDCGPNAGVSLTRGVAIFVNVGGTDVLLTAGTTADRSAAGAFVGELPPP